MTVFLLRKNFFEILQFEISKFDRQDVLYIKRYVRRTIKSSFLQIKYSSHGLRFMYHTVNLKVYIFEILSHQRQKDKFQP